MCGIAGYYTSPDARAERELLLDMAGELRHRGPDGVGLYQDGRFGMVNTRLAIIDVQGGDQPLSDERGRYWVMQNGEVYNYPELQAAQRAAGRTLSTGSDSETILHAWALEGSEPGRLRITFAPAGTMEEFFAATVSMSGLPSLAELAPLFAAHGMSITGPPLRG